jgi:CheY-like chemotaxis protein
LVQRARKITHRRRTPIVMLSGSNCETEAWGAGVEAFLRKPQQISKLPATINRVLKAERKKD